jgi:hypothetical protein
VRWKTTAPLLANHVGYTDEAFKALGSNREHAKWDPAFPKTTEGDVDQLIVEFLAEIFTQPVPPGSEYRYKVSVAIAEKLFLDDIFDGLLYPTVQMKANADNFALKPRYADTNLRFLKAEFVRIKAVRAFAYDLDVLDTATELMPDGTIVWKGHHDRWTLRNEGDQLTFVVEDGEWVARDAAGQVVDPD